MWHLHGNTPFASLCISATIFLPRGLITAAVGIQIAEARGAEFEFLPSLVLAVILITNLALRIGSMRARKLFPEPILTTPEPVVPQMET